MISVIAEETQYFIAESTKTIDLVDATKYAPGDDLWIGCSEVSKAGRLCERTIAVAPTQEGQFPAFVVSDLSKDERFCNLPFVSGPPYLRFYAGTPLITKRGIPIGSLFVVDERVRQGLSADETHFMGTMAATIMRHMEITREVEEHRRGMKMSRGLASFVEGRSELEEDEVDDNDEGATVAGQFEDPVLSISKSKAGSARGSVANSVASSLPHSNISMSRKEREYSASMLKTEVEILNSTGDHGADAYVHEHIRDTESIQSNRLSQDLSDMHGETYNGKPDMQGRPDSVGGLSMSVSSPPTAPIDKIGTSPAADDESESSIMKVLFSRAANLIREAFEVDGGAIFYDAQKGFSSEFGVEPTCLSSAKAHTEGPGDISAGEDTNSEAADFHGSTSPHSDTRNFLPPMHPDQTPCHVGSGVFSRSSIVSERTVEILGFSTGQASSVHGDACPGSEVFAPFNERSLHSLLRRYPRGKLWTFDGDGCVSSSEEDIIKPGSGIPPIANNSGGRVLSQKKKRARAAVEAKFLLRHFSGVRQLLFVPLWDAGRSRWLSGCFVWSIEPTRILSKQNELAFLTAFGNSVMAECSRIDTEIADQKKGDFIGSISHELRSPLHGILASAEFLGDEITEGFTKGLVETIDSCGRTLLDTIVS
jgi:hypothetical protein